MRLDDAECWGRLESARHGVLATVNAVRGVDAVPVVFALDGRRILVPIDTIKPKSTLDLGRVANLQLDRRCALLVDSYAEDWSKLWWVRVHATGSLATGRLDDLVPVLARRFRAYRAPGAVSAVIVLEPSGISGWSAAGA